MLETVCERVLVPRTIVTGAGNGPIPLWTEIRDGVSPRLDSTMWQVPLGEDRSGAWIPHHTARVTLIQPNRVIPLLQILLRHVCCVSSHPRVSSLYPVPRAVR